MIGSQFALLLKVAVCYGRFEILFFHEIFKRNFMLLLSGYISIGIKSGITENKLEKSGKSTFDTSLVLLGINHLKSPHFFPWGVVINAHIA